MILFNRKVSSLYTMKFDYDFMWMVKLYTEILRNQFFKAQ